MSIRTYKKENGDIIEVNTIYDYFTHRTQVTVKNLKTLEKIVDSIIDTPEEIQDEIYEIAMNRDATLIYKD